MEVNCFKAQSVINDGLDKVFVTHMHDLAVYIKNPLCFRLA